MRLARLAGASFVLVTALLAGCGGNGSTKMPATSTASDQKLGATEIGQQAGDLYVRALSEVTDMLKGKPEVAQVRSRVQDLRESYIRKLVELGKAREALDAAGKSTVDAAI